jgi:hypothetical protein
MQSASTIVAAYVSYLLLSANRSRHSSFQPSFFLAWTIVTSSCLSEINYHSNAERQNCRREVLFSLHPNDRIIPALLQCHWLSVDFRVRFKVAASSYSRLSRQLSFVTYPNGLTVDRISSRRSLRTTYGTDFSVPWTRTRFTERVFLAAEPML